MWTFNRSELQSHLDEGHIREVIHPSGTLKLYNYTAKCQYDNVWTPVTKACRGLIVSSEDTVIARPFPKFFNLEQHDPKDLPNEPFKVFDKLDGSLGGSGSPQTANLNLQVVANEEHMQADKVHVLGFREGQGLSDKAGEALTNCVVETFNVSRKSSFFADSLMLLVGDNSLISFPKVTEDETFFVGVRYVAPKLLARSATASSYDASNDLPGLFAKSQPYPELFSFAAYKRPHFVEFKLYSSRYFRSYECIAKGRRYLGFF